MKPVSLSLASVLVMAASSAGANPAPPDAVKDGAQVRQIETASRSAEKARIEALNVGAENRRKTAEIGQLPADAEARDVGAGPEMSIGLSESGPEARLYDQVAEVWTMIRKRGLQPSPELIAQEIGPDALAQFLDQYPDASDMFGKDQDMLPVDPSGGTGLPESGATINLPSPGAG